MVSLQPGVLEGPGMKAPLDKVAVLPERLADQVKFLPFYGCLFPPDAMRKQYSAWSSSGLWTQLALNSPAV